jgi:hypothetical protein
MNEMCCKDGDRAVTTWRTFQTALTCIRGGKRKLRCFAWPVNALRARWTCGALLAFQNFANNKPTLSMASRYCVHPASRRIYVTFNQQIQKVFANNYLFIVTPACFDMYHDQRTVFVLNSHAN